MIRAAGWNRPQEAPFPQTEINQSDLQWRPSTRRAPLQLAEEEDRPNTAEEEA